MFGNGELEAGCALGTILATRSLLLPSAERLEELEGLGIVEEGLIESPDGIFLLSVL